jgi:hypothetical protein
MREKQNQAAQQHIDTIDAEESKLDDVEDQLNAIKTTSGTPEDARKQRLLLAIEKKRASLDRQKASLKQFLDADDDQERLQLWQEYKQEKAQFTAHQASSDQVADVCIPCEFHLGSVRTRSKTVWAQIAIVAFSGDHRVLRPSPGDYDDQPAAPFDAPQWVSAAGLEDRNYPVSYTRSSQVKIVARFQFWVTGEPEGQSASWTKVRGLTEVQMVPGGQWYAAKNLTFDGAPTTGSVKTGICASREMAGGPLWDIVWDFRLRIHWYVQAEGKWLKAGDSQHVLYSTLATPAGQIECPSNNVFVSSGQIQDITEERLQLAMDAVRHRYQDHRKYCRTEVDCAEAVFYDLKARGVGYSLGHRWLKTYTVNVTGIEPYPTLHHYLWRTNAATALGECHNIAAAFILMCQILGVKGAMEVGYMRPRAGRSDTPPRYPWAGGDVGAWNTVYTRIHQLSGHGRETLVFVDGNHFANNFEGAARFAGRYYAIGEDIYNSPSDFYGFQTEGKWNGAFGLFFPPCSQPYPDHWKQMVRRDPQTGEESTVAGFYWHWGRS